MFASRPALLGAVLGASGALALSAPGCGLFAAVDRDLIPQGGGSGSGGGGGSGGECAIATDCPGSDTPCASRTCAEATCGMSFAAEGQACSEGGGNVCDGSGACVECLEDDHCDPFYLCNPPLGQCEPGPCADGVQNGEETGVDCGGPVCDPC